MDPASAVPVTSQQRPPFRAAVQASLWSIAFLVAASFAAFRGVVGLQGSVLGSVGLAGYVVAFTAPFLLAGFTLFNRGHRFLGFVLPLLIPVALVALSIASLGQPNIGLGFLVVMAGLSYEFVLLPGIAIATLVGILGDRPRSRAWAIALVALAFAGAIGSALYVSPLEQERQIYGSAASDPSKCESSSNRNYCYRDIAFQLKDPSICDQGFPQHDSWWVTCYQSIARATGRPQLCVGDDGQDKQDCIASAITATKDIARCAELSNNPINNDPLNPSREAMCIEGLSGGFPSATWTPDQLAQWCTRLKQYDTLLRNAGGSLLPLRQRYESSCSS